MLKCCTQTHWEQKQNSADHLWLCCICKIGIFPFSNYQPIFVWNDIFSLDLVINLLPHTVSVHASFHLSYSHALHTSESDHLVLLSKLPFELMQDATQNRFLPCPGGLEDWIWLGYWASIGLLQTLNPTFPCGQGQNHTEEMLPWTLSLCKRFIYNLLHLHYGWLFGFSVPSSVPASVQSAFWYQAVPWEHQNVSLSLQISTHVHIKKCFLSSH